MLFHTCTIGKSLIEVGCTNASLLYPLNGCRLTLLLSLLDLKYENVLFVSDHPQSEIKVIDFGLSKKYGKDEELMDGVGTM